MLERHELEAFLTLAEELHFGRTAERMRVSTGRVSQIIGALERRVGALLFRRTSRRVELTAIGRRLEQDLRPAWEAIGAGLERAVRAGRGFDGELRVGFTGTPGGQLLVDAAELCRARQPGCEVVIREVQPADAAARLLGGEVELLLTCLRLEVDGLAAGPVLVTEPQLLAVPAGHRLAGRESVPVAELDGVRVLDPEAGLQEVLTFVGAGQGVCPVGAHVRRYHPRPDVRYVRLDGAAPLHWRLHRRADGATARVRLFEEALRELLDGVA
ncbi:LysR substrate-binding domain-containing protein [Kitasatospora sp. NPDC002040]|uniref:LysR family transcriptional regulator n=1 Tax=Kitasatospora sp. NPDC002040 TaxID=3154661 RepID=UPI00331D7A88